MLENQYITAKQVETAFGKPVYEIINKHHNSGIAKVGWYPKWERYVVFPYPNTVFDVGCLESIVKFVKESHGKN